MTRIGITRSTVLLLACAGESLQAQSFKVGDYVETNNLTVGKWEPCRISKPMVRNQYGIDCGPVRTYSEPRFIRPRAATSEDTRIEAETAAALVRQPHGGATLGAKYGTREPMTCANRTVPAHGAPSPEQARQYFLCEQEGDGIVFLSLVTNARVQVAPASHRPDPRASYATAPDLNQPAWDIRGSFTEYRCQTPPKVIASYDTVSDFARTHNCTATDMPNATGLCYKNNFGDWHCYMRDGVHTLSNTRSNQLPPVGN
jgi:hypothetical protein